MSASRPQQRRMPLRRGTMKMAASRSIGDITRSLKVYSANQMGYRWRTSTFFGNSVYSAPPHIHAGMRWTRITLLELGKDHSIPKHPELVAD